MLTLDRSRRIAIARVLVGTRRAKKNVTARVLVGTRRANYFVSRGSPALIARAAPTGGAFLRQHSASRCWASAGSPCSRALQATNLVAENRTAPVAAAQRRWATHPNTTLGSVGERRRTKKTTKTRRPSGSRRHCRDRCHRHGPSRHQTAAYPGCAGKDRLAGSSIDAAAAIWPSSPHP